MLDLAFIAAESALAIGLASASYHLFEKKILSLKRYFVTSREDSAELAAKSQRMTLAVALLPACDFQEP